MPRISRETDLIRLGEIADSTENHELLFAERAVILDRRHRAKDVSDSALARAARIERSSVYKAIQPDRVAKAKATLAAAKKTA
jgi:hypothetical protein